MLISHRPQSVTLASTSTIAKTAAREKFELGAQEQLQVTPASEVANQAIDTTLEFPSLFNPASTRQENYNATKDKNDDFSVSLNTALASIENAQKTNSASSTTAYGYSVDSKGFMGADFNAAAGLPADFKIHKSTLDTMVKNSTESMWLPNAWTKNDVYFENIDIANTIGQYYNLFSSLVDTSKKSFTNAELGDLPAGYEFDRGKEYSAKDWFDDYSNAKVTHIYSKSDISELSELSSQGFVGLPRALEFSAKNMSSEYSPSSFKPDMSVYESGEEYSIESVFVSFLKSNNAGILRGGETKLSGEFDEPVRIQGGLGISLDEIRRSQDKFDEWIEYLKEELKVAGQNGVWDEYYQKAQNTVNNPEKARQILNEAQKIYARAKV